MSLETVDLATPGLGWAGHLGTVLTHLQQRRGWAGLGWAAGLGDPPPPEQNTL